MTIERGSDKHGPMRDEELKHETRGMMTGGKQTHAEEWRQVEPSGEDEPDVDRAPEGTLTGGTPAGMTPADVDFRSQLAGYLHRSQYPCVREILIGDAIDNGAPTSVVDEIRRLPSGREFANLGEVWSALGHPAEAARF